MWKLKKEAKEETIKALINEFNKDEKKFLMLEAMKLYANTDADMVKIEALKILSRFVYI